MYLLLTYEDNELIDAPEYFNSYEDAMSEANKLAKGCEDNTTFEVFKLVDRLHGQVEIEPEWYEYGYKYKNYRFAFGG